ncbi:hypothetical protein PsYK624_053660 [Phanerochaete sordida]|uniref:Uncharacterized protein n=1 Tax=Phanerochaete sordida TaxID=48140 RepID=A0A9P3G8D2_9APHY|nr:hypothetical protein PsYK624_053660 [Phanerochaete sordida]
MVGTNPGRKSLLREAAFAFATGRDVSTRPATLGRDSERVSAAFGAFRLDGPHHLWAPVPHADAFALRLEAGALRGRGRMRGRRGVGVRGQPDVPLAPRRRMRCAPCLMTRRCRACRLPSQARRRTLPRRRRARCSACSSRASTSAGRYSTTCATSMRCCKSCTRMAAARSCLCRSS